MSQYMEEHIREQLVGRLSAGYRIIESPHLPSLEEIQTRFPRCNKKKRRIRKKFRKKYSATVPCRKFYIMGDTITCSPSMAAELRRSLEGKRIYESRTWPNPGNSKYDDNEAPVLPKRHMAPFQVSTLNILKRNFLHGICA